MVENLTVSVALADGRTVVHLAGELDSSTAAVVREHADSLLVPVGDARVCSLIEFDLSELRFCGSTGIACFLSFAKAATEAGTHVTFTNQQPTIRRVLKLAGVDQFLDLADGLESTG